MLELVKDDAKDWLEIIETIERHISLKTGLSAAERADVRRIGRMSGELKALIRG